MILPQYFFFELLCTASLSLLFCDELVEDQFIICVVANIHLALSSCLILIYEYSKKNSAAMHNNEKKLQYTLFTLL